MKMVERKVICEKAYLYSTFKQDIEVREGRVLKVRTVDIAIFECLGEVGHYYNVSLYPEIIYNRMIWLPECRDDEYVRTLYLIDAEKRMDKAMEKFRKIKMEHSYFKSCVIKNHSQK